MECFLYVKTYEKIIPVFVSILLIDTVLSNRIDFLSYRFKKIKRK
jgi:hypothetical protein